MRLPFRRGGDADGPGGAERRVLDALEGAMTPSKPSLRERLARLNDLGRSRMTGGRRASSTLAAIRSRLSGARSRRPAGIGAAIRRRLPGRARLPQPPPLVADLYRDLRDRRLLPVVGLLLAATLAVPFALSSSPAEEDGGGAGASDAQRSAELALETQPAVLAQPERVRDFRRRLRAFRSKNPFEQQAPTKLDNDLAEQIDDLLSGKLGEDGGADGLAGGGGGSLPGAGAPGGGSPPAASQPRTQFWEHRVDVRFGEVGETKLRSHVKQLELLPSDHLPVVSYLGVTRGEKSAVFLVSQAAGSQGEGSCAPSEETCQFLTLALGETQFLDIGAGTDDHVTYEMKLVRIRRVKLRKNEKVETESAPEPSQPQSGGGEQPQAQPGGDGSGTAPSSLRGGAGGESPGGEGAPASSSGLAAWLGLN